MNPTGADSFYKPDTIVAQTRQAMNENQPVLTQVSQDSPLFQPSLQTPPESPMPNRSPMQGFTQGLMQKPPMGLPTLQGQQKPTQNPLHQRADLIVKALTSHLAQLDKILGGQQGGAR